MGRQLAIDTFEDISERDLKLFVVCNQANRNWFSKQLFYQFKNKLLTKHNHPNGFDLQIIERPCYNCNGTGIYHGREVCHSCRKGIYSTSYILLARYLLNGVIFHIPHLTQNDAHTYINPNTVFTDFNYTNVIRGLVEHKETKFSADVALVELLLKYDRPMFIDYMVCNGTALRTTALAKWKRCFQQPDKVKAAREYFGECGDVMQSA